MDVLVYINGRSLLSTMTFYTASHFVPKVWYWAIVHSQHCCNSVFSIMANRKLCSTLSGTLTICGTQRNPSSCYGGTDLFNMRLGILFQNRSVTPKYGPILGSFVEINWKVGNSTDFVFIYI